MLGVELFMRESIDRRIERTKRDLRSAFIKLITENESKEITIKEITDLANYNRSTFYAHYTDKEMLIEDIIDDAIESLINTIESNFKNGEVPLSVKLSSNNSKVLFTYIEKNKSMFSLLFDVSKFPSFQEKLCYALKDLIESDTHFIKKYKEKLDRGLYSYTQSAALVGRINYWIKEGYNFNADYMAEQMVGYLKLFK